MQLMNTQSPIAERSRKNADIINITMQSMKKMPSRAERAGITKKQLESLYALGFKLYKTVCFQQAADIFKLLCFYEPRDSRNWIALGGANQHTKNHYASAAAFAMASMYDPLNPEPKYYAAHCFIDLKDLSSALKCAQTSLQLCKMVGDNNHIRPRVQGLCNALAAHQLTQATST